MSIFDEAVTESVSRVAEIGIGVGELDQEAALLRAQLKAVLGDRPMTDELLAGVALGAYVVTGSLISLHEEGLISDTCRQAAELFAAATVARTETLRRSAAPSEFDFSAAWSAA